MPTSVTTASRVDVDAVRLLDDRHVHWHATFAGKEEKWDAVITQHVPDQEVAWGRGINGGYIDSGSGSG